MLMFNVKTRMEDFYISGPFKMLLCFIYSKLLHRFLRKQSRKMAVETDCYSSSTIFISLLLLLLLLLLHNCILPPPSPHHYNSIVSTTTTTVLLFSPPHPPPTFVSGFFLDIRYFLTSKKFRMSNRIASCQ